MAFLSRLADRLILCPSTKPIDPKGKTCQIISTPHGEVESWIGCYPDPSTQSPAASCDLVIIKFPGTGGRAERAGVHPVEVWSDFTAEVWAINPHGYGGSSGRASLKFVAAMADSVFDHIQAARPGVPIVVVGNSLGCMSALYVAANRPVAGVMLRNPPALRELISQRRKYAAWNFGLSAYVANQIPEELLAVPNAGRAEAPCLFVQSEADRVVPVEYQNLIISAYAGPKNIFSIAGADHHELVQEDQQQDYFVALRWLREQLRV